VCDESKKIVAVVASLKTEVEALKETVGGVSALPLKVETLYGDIKVLTEVIRMSRAEQKQFNEYALRILDKHDEKIDDLRTDTACLPQVKGDIEGHDKRLGKAEKRLSYYAGAVAVIGVVGGALKLLL
jgi:hypothetical protein